MRRLNLRSGLGALAAVVGLVSLPLVASAVITGSAHDFTTETWNTTGEICVVCHTPHNGDTTAADAPLWNHVVSSATFTPYTGPGTLDATDVGQPDGPSLLCLSCHDGTVGLGQFGGNTTNADLITGPARVGTDLSNDHPISFAYTDGLATTDGQLFAPTTTNSGLGGTIQADMLFLDKVQCASCHDVHNGPGATGPLLVKTNAASALCLTCHNK
jgi:predicted CXXCH cytochrome family protein